MTVEAPPAHEPDQRRRALRVPLAGMLVLAFVAAGGYGYYHWSHPRVFYSAGGTKVSYVGHDDRRGREQSMAFGMSDMIDTTSSTNVEVVDARPVVEENTSRARLRVVVCRIDGSAGIGAIGSIAVGRLPSECSQIVPAGGVTMHLSRQYADQLVLEVTPHRAGVVFVHGLDVTYHHGWQRGTQHLGVSVKVTTP